MKKLKRMISAIMVLALMVTCMVAAPTQAKAASYTSLQGSFTFSGTTRANTALVAKKEDLNANAVITVVSPNMEVLRTSKVSLFLLYKYPNLSMDNYATKTAIFEAAGSQSVQYYSGKATQYFEYVVAGSTLPSSMLSSVTVTYYFKP